MTTEQKLNSIQRKYKEGFTEDELEMVLEIFYPVVKEKQLKEALTGITCFLIANEGVHPFYDVLQAIESIINKTPPKTWD